MSTLVEDLLSARPARRGATAGARPVDLTHWSSTSFADAHAPTRHRFALDLPDDPSRCPATRCG
jgi:hypothetical protein